MFPARRTILHFVIAMLFISLLGCRDNKPKVQQGPVLYKKDTATIASQGKMKAPIINIIDTVTLKQTVLVVKDSASTSQAVGEKMAHIFDSILPKLAKEKKLEIVGPKMAWYRSSTKPFFFEAGFPVDKAPSGKLPKKVLVKKLAADSAVIAHFFGPYDLTYQAYEALTEWLKDRNKKRSGAAYEIYIGNIVDAEGRAVDPYRVQTDIVFPHR